MGDGGLRRELAGIALLLFALFLLGALLAAPDLEAGASCMSARGGFGPVGACLRGGLRTLLGTPAALLVPLAPAVHALRLFGRLESDTDRSWLVFLAGVSVLLPVALGLARDAGPPTFDPLAGVWGGFASYYLSRAFGSVGAWIVLAIAVSALAAATLRWNPVRALVGPTAGGGATGAKQAAWRRRWRATTPDLATRMAPTPEEMPAIDPRLMAAGGTPLEAPMDDADLPTRRRRDRKRGPATTEDVAGFGADVDAASGDPLVGDQLPPSDLLSPAAPTDVDANRRELDAMGEKLMDALRTFRVDGELVGRTTGPVVTQFEIEPAPGVKVRQFATLSNDLALAMRAPSIRIVAPIPGRGAVGVEVPNPVAEIVAFRDLIEVREFQHARAALPIALGKNLEGKPVVADLAKMPHLLIAGATGSGKSVCVNTLITSLVYRHTPRTLRFLMVDPKMVELSVYNDLPHLKYRVVTDNRDAAAVLKWAVMEMQDRYALLAANGCRNIQDFNRRVADGASLERPKAPDVAFENTRYTDGVLPYIVVVIDELADLMMTVQGEVETPLALLAQKARAIGIHLILATQRPSVNVITGLIKANFPSRIAFRVASQVDSRTIIDGVGAETLLGNGDMLFIPPGKSEPQRLQGAFISSEDTERVMRWYAGRRDALRATRAGRGVEEDVATPEPDILELVRQKELLDAQGTDADDEGDAEGGNRDKLFREAAEVVIHNQHGSTSLLQRRLGIGYGRAARIIDQLHAAGVLGPPNGSKPRDILVGLEEVDRICGRNP